LLFGSAVLSSVSACKQEAPSLAPEVGEAVSDLGAPVASELVRTLVGHLTAAMEDGGPSGAVEFCSEEALPLTEQVRAQASDGFELKRTSFRTRNPLNSPDEAEEAALEYFEKILAAGGDPPESYVQQVSESEYRYYRPLFVAEPCTQCHGQIEDLDPAVRSVLEDRYPTDLATGYSPGDFRGVIRVSVPAAAISMVTRPEGQAGGA
jgi:hypothetical protein